MRLSVPNNISCKDPFPHTPHHHNKHHHLNTTGSHVAGILYSMLRVYLPGGTLEWIRPYSLRIHGNTEARNHTILCSFCSPLGTWLMSWGQLGGGVVPLRSPMETFNLLKRTLRSVGQAILLSSMTKLSSVKESE